MGQWASNFKPNIDFFFKCPDYFSLLYKIKHGLSEIFTNFVYIRIGSHIPSNFLYKQGQTITSIGISSASSYRLNPRTINKKKTIVGIFKHQQTKEKKKPLKISLQKPQNSFLNINHQYIFFSSNYPLSLILILTRKAIEYADH